MLRLDQIEREIAEAEDRFAAERMALKRRIDELAAAEVELLHSAPSRYRAERTQIETDVADLARREQAAVAEFWRRVRAIGKAIKQPPSGKLNG